MNSSVGELQDGAPFFFNLPFAKRWDCHKATIEKFHLDGGNTLEATVKHMKTHYMFDAR